MEIGISIIMIHTLLETMGLIGPDRNRQVPILGDQGIMVIKVLESEITISMETETKVSMDKEIKISMVKGIGCSKTKGARVSKQKIFKMFRNKDLGIPIIMETKISIPLETKDSKIKDILNSRAMDFKIPMLEGSKEDSQDQEGEEMVGNFLNKYKWITKF